MNLCMYVYAVIRYLYMCSGTHTAVCGGNTVNKEYVQVYMYVKDRLPTQPASKLASRL